MGVIFTYQDYLEAEKATGGIAAFLITAIHDHRGSEEYRVALDAEDYYKHRNPTIMRFQQFVYNMYGKAVPDKWSANNKIANRYYFQFITQLTSYLLGNGATFNGEDTKKRLGKTFDRKLQDAAVAAQNGGVSFGFWNYDHLEVFKFTEFVPLWDEETGELKAGIRFWQINPSKPLRMTLFDVDGYTEYIKRPKEDLTVLQEKRPYIITSIGDTIDKAQGTEIRQGQNYGTLPIVPLWNINHQSELVGNQGTLDAYDLIASQLVNNVDDGNFVYWILKNCSGMSVEDDEAFLEQLRITHVAHADGGDGASIEAHSVQAQYEANEVTLSRLRKQLYEDFMALDVSQIAAGQVTATQIESAYDPLNEKADMLEFNIIDFVDEILRLAGIDDEVSFHRSRISNEKEQTEMVLQASTYLDEETVLKKLGWISVDEIKSIMEKKDLEEADRYTDGDPITGGGNE